MGAHSELTTLRQYGRHFFSPGIRVNVIKNCKCEMGGVFCADTFDTSLLLIVCALR